MSTVVEKVVGLGERRSDKTYKAINLFAPNTAP